MTARPVGAFLLWLVAAHPAVAQLPAASTAGGSWAETGYPKIYYTNRDGLTLGYHYGQFMPLGFAEYGAAPPYRASLSVDGLLAASGRKDLTLAARLPYLWPGWRMLFTFDAFRHPHDWYFGVGNATAYHPDSVTDAQPNLYDVERRTLAVRGEVQRRIAGGLRALAGWDVARRRLLPPDGPSVFASDPLGGGNPAVTDYTVDAAWRLGLVFDTRDDEVSPSRGVLLELIHAVADSGLLGNAQYSRTTGSAAAYLPLGPSTVIAARAVGQRMGGNPPLGAYGLVEASDGPYAGLGGPRSHRTLITRRYLGRHQLFGNLDLRRQVYAVPSLIEVTAVGFVDAGRVFAGDEFRVTARGLHVGGGVGLFIQWTRAGLLGTTLGRGPDGWLWRATTRWAF